MNDIFYNIIVLIKGLSLILSFLIFIIEAIIDKKKDKYTILPGVFVMLCLLESPAPIMSAIFELFFFIIWLFYIKCEYNNIPKPNNKKFLNFKKDKNKYFKDYKIFNMNKYKNGSFFSFYILPILIVIISYILGMFIFYRFETIYYMSNTFLIIISLSILSLIIYLFFNLILFISKIFKIKIQWHKEKCHVTYVECFKKAREEFKFTNFRPYLIPIYFGIAIL